MKVGTAIMFKLSEETYRPGIVVAEHPSGEGYNCVIFFNGPGDTSHTGDSRPIGWHTALKVGNEVGQISLPKDEPQVSPKPLLQPKVK